MHVTPLELAQLEELANGAASRAYAPYSRFFVGAAVLLASGRMFAGCNVENSSYRLTVCAEQNALAAAVAAEGPVIHVHAVVVTNRARVACSPCGACRQTIAEFAAEDALVRFPGEGGEPVTATLKDLLPATFRLVPA